MRGFGYDVSISKSGQLMSVNETGNKSIYSRKVQMYNFENADWNKIGEAISPNNENVKYGVSHVLAKNSKR